jgi:hypothetical protein
LHISGLWTNGAWLPKLNDQHILLNNNKLQNVHTKDVDLNEIIIWCSLFEIYRCCW